MKPRCIHFTTPPEWPASPRQYPLGAPRRSWNLLVWLGWLLGGRR
jgi:hypothetical protein